MRRRPRVSEAMVVYSRARRVVIPSRLSLRKTILSSTATAYRLTKKRGRPKKCGPHAQTVWSSSPVAVAISEDRLRQERLLDACGPQKLTVTAPPLAPEVISPVVAMPTSAKAVGSEKYCKDGRRVRKPPVSSPTVRVNLNMVSENQDGVAEYRNAVPKTAKKKRKNARLTYYRISDINNNITSSMPQMKAFKDGRFASSDNMATNVALGLGENDITPYILDVKPGENILEKVSCFPQFGHTGCILSAHGIVSQAMIHTVASGTVTYEGRFHIVLLTGTFQLSEDTEDLPRKIPELKLSLAGFDYRLFCGRIAGPLIAASPVQIVVGSFIRKSQSGISY